MQEESHNNAVKMFRGSEVTITIEGRCHIGVVIGSNTVKITYTKTPAGDFFKQLKLLSVYSAFDGGFKGKLMCFMRTVPSLRDFLKSLEEVV